MQFEECLNYSDSRLSARDSAEHMQELPGWLIPAGAMRRAELKGAEEDNVDRANGGCSAYRTLRQELFN